MAELKTKKTRKSVAAFLKGIKDERRRADANAVAAMMGEVTGEKPAMWGDSIVGYGSYHYRYESGREGDWFLTGFSPRKSSLSLYLMSGFTGYDDLLARLGKHKTGKSCLYLNKLADVDAAVLRRLIEKPVAHVKRREKAQNA